MTVERPPKSSLLRGEIFSTAFERIFKGIKRLGTRYSFSIHKPPIYAACPRIADCPITKRNGKVA